MEGGSKLGERDSGEGGGKENLIFSSCDFGCPPHPPTPPRDGSERNRVCVCVCVFSQAPRTPRPTRARWWPLIERARRRGPVFPWRGIHGTGSSALVGRADACKQPCKQPAVGVVSSRQVAGGLGKVAGQGGTRTPSSPPPSLGGGAGW